MSIRYLIDTDWTIHYLNGARNVVERVDEFLRGIPTLGIDAETCKRFGRERGRLRAVGRMIGDFDLLIGVSALRHDLALLTNNRRHFGEIEGVRIESV